MYVPKHAANLPSSLQFSCQHKEGLRYFDNKFLQVALDCEEEGCDGVNPSQVSEFNSNPPPSQHRRSQLMHTKCMFLVSRFGNMRFKKSLPIGIHYRSTSSHPFSLPLKFLGCKGVGFSPWCFTFQS